MNNQIIEQLSALLDLLVCIGEIALEEGEEWRLQHSKLMDAYQRCVEMMSDEE